MISPCPRIMVAGTHSGVGKTSVTLALVAALRKRGLKVQCFKVGPDYLDPTYLRLASGRPCYNLDGWMMGRDYVESLFNSKACDGDIAVVEGVMGLYDGAHPTTPEGSTAELAGWLEAPVILVVNVHGMARSVAALVKGFSELEGAPQIRGVIANQCGSEVHRGWIREALGAFGLPAVVGTIPRGAFPDLPSRHLGLVTADGCNLGATTLEALGAAMETHGSVDEILRIARGTERLGASAKTRAGLGRTAAGSIAGKSGAAEESKDWVAKVTTQPLDADAARSVSDAGVLKESSLQEKKVGLSTAFPIFGRTSFGQELTTETQRHREEMKTPLGSLREKILSDLQGSPVAVLKNTSPYLRKEALSSAEGEVPVSMLSQVPLARARVRLGVAFDEAFHFYYQDNLDALEASGAELVRFSPLHDGAVPENLDALYLGGGYPEEHAQALSANESMLESIKEFAKSGRPVYAECGGLMYLCQGIERLDGSRYAQAELLPCWTKMLPRLKSLGYVEVTLAADSLFGPQGSRLRGHEFHYSELVGDPLQTSNWEAVYRVQRRRGDHGSREGYRQGNVLMSYCHLHFASRPGSVEHFLQRCSVRRRRD